MVRSGGPRIGGPSGNATQPPSGGPSALMDCSPVERGVENGRRIGGPKSRVLTATTIVVLLLGLRLFGLASYPPAMPDEGFWASGPRNWVLFGHPLLDNRLHSFLSPATFAALSVWFSIFSPSLMSARCFSVVTGLLSCAAIGILGQR